MIRIRFTRQLNQLNTDLLEMGALTEQAIANAVKALVHQDSSAAKAAVDLEREIDAQERTIETLCLKLLLEQQPVAGDLRLVSSALKMITDMERIGDQAADISEIVLGLVGQSYIKPLEHLPLMGDKAIEMVTGAIDAYVQKDLAKAQRVIAMDEEVDNYFLIIRRDLIDMIHKNPDCGEQAIDLIMIAKYFERIGDHAQNIAEWVVYSLTGIHKSIEV